VHFSFCVCNGYCVGYRPIGIFKYLDVLPTAGGEEFRIIMLKSVYLSLRKVKVQRVTVVNFGM